MNQNSKAQNSCDKNLLKEMAAKAAVDALVKNNMKLGLGSGSTAILAVRYVGELLKKETLQNIKAVSTSFQTTIECEKLGIPLFTLNSSEINGSIDLTIDGADEVDPKNRCIKGGGGALLLEKIIAYSSNKYAIIIDESKIVQNLGLAFPVPVEVIPEARLSVTMRLEDMGAEVKLREAVRKAGPVITDHGNLLLDILFKDIIDPVKFEMEIKNIPGVVENGFFTGPGFRPLRPVIFIARKDNQVEQRE